LVDRVLRRLEAVIPERQGHRPGEVLDRGDLLEDLLEAGLGGNVVTAGFQSRGDPVLPTLVAEEPVEAVGLQCEEVRDLEWFTDLCKGDASRGGTSRGCARGGQEWSFRWLAVTSAQRKPPV